MSDEPRRRPGGRSARVRESVLRAASELSDERGEAALSIEEIAVRSGVHPTTVYRRWGTLGAVLLDAAVARLAVEAPLPDRGSLRADLLAYAEQARRGIRAPGGLRLLQAVLAVAGTPDGEADLRRAYLDARAAGIQAMLDRDTARGGRWELNWREVTDGILAPLYFRRLFAVEVPEGYTEALVDRVLAPARAPGPVLTPGP